MELCLAAAVIAVLSEVWAGATGEPLLPKAVPILKLHGNLTQVTRGLILAE